MIYLFEWWHVLTCLTVGTCWGYSLSVGGTYLVIVIFICICLSVGGYFVYYRDVWSYLSVWGGAFTSWSYIICLVNGGYWSGWRYVFSCPMVLLVCLMVFICLVMVGIYLFYGIYMSDCIYLCDSITTIWLLMVFIPYLRNGTAVFVSLMVSIWSMAFTCWWYFICSVDGEYLYICLMVLICSIVFVCLMVFHICFMVFICLMALICL